MPQLQNKITADDINTAYKQRYITAEQRNNKMRRLATDNLEEMIGEHGALFSYFKQTLKHANENWDDLVKLATEYKSTNKDNSVTGAFGDTAQMVKLAGQVMWNEVQMIMAPMTAFGEVNGKIAEHYALKAGASPGLAKVINVAVDVGSGLLPTGKLAQSFARGVQKNAPGVAAIPGRISAIFGKGATRAAETGAKEAVAGTVNAERIVEDAINQGLKADGVDIAVFHGSPHKFDVLDMSKIGTGEGHQAYGFGVYFAQNAKTAESYSVLNVSPRLKMVLDDVGGDIRKAVKSLQNNDPHGLLNEAQAALSQGQLYTAKIPASQVSKMLEWDKPLNKQSLEVRKALEPAMGEIRDEFIKDASKWGKPSAEDLKHYTDQADRIISEMTGEEIYRKIRQLPEDASLALSKLGIPGIKYLDQGSRAKGAGTSNFVVFTDNVLKDFSRITQPTVQQQFISDMRQFKNEIAKVTETKTHEMTAKEAEKLGLTIEDLKGFLGDKVSEAEMYGYLKALDPVVDSMISSAKAGLAGDAAAGDAALKTLQEFFDYAPKFRKAEVTAGRSVEILKESPPMKPITDMLRGWDPESIAKMDFDAAKTTILEDLVEMGNDVAKLKATQIQNVTQVKDVSFWDKLRTVYMSGLLLPPISAIRNFVGNSFSAVDSIVTRELAGWLSIDKAKGVVRGEGFAQAQGMGMAFGDGARKWAEAFKNIGPEEATKFDLAPYRFTGPLGRFWQSGSDNMRGMDNFFKALFVNGDIYAQALNKGRHSGLEGAALADYVARRVHMPTNSMIEHAKDFALNQTYQNDLGTLGKATRSLLQAGPLITFFPFMKTPMNLAKYVWNRTPGLQFLSKSLYEDILAGGTRADMSIARLTLSTLMGQFWFGLAQQGLLTGGGPVDPGLRRTWLAAKQPYAFAGSSSWWQPGQLDPATTSIWMMADFAEIINQLDDPTAEQTAMAITLAGVRDIVDKSYWQTVGQAVDFISSVRSGEQPGRNALNLITGPLVTIASGGPLDARIARAIDPVRREARGFIDQIMSRIPGFSKELGPMRDPWGDPFVPPQPLGGGWAGLLNPMAAKGYENDPIKKEGARLQAKIPMFPWSIGGKTVDDFDVRTALPGDPLPVDLTPEQRDRWQVIYREILRHPERGIKKVLLDNPDYQATPWAGQRNAYMNYMAVAREGAKEAMMTEFPDLARKMGEATVGKYLPMIQPGMRPQVEAQISENLDLLESLMPQERANLEQFGIMGSGEDRDKASIEMQLNAVPTNSPVVRQPVPAAGQ